MSRKSPRDLFPYRFREGQEEALDFVRSNFPRKNICLDAATGFGKTPIILSVLLTDDWPVIWAVRTGNETDRPVEELKAMNEASDENFFGFSYREKRDMCLLARDRDIESYRGVSTLCDREKEHVRTTKG